MKPMMTIPVVMMILVIGTGAVRAADKLDCDDPSVAADLSTLALGAITGGKVNFVANHSDRSACPSAEAACRRRAFLLDANLIVFAQELAKSGYVCGAFLDAKNKETDGWLPTANVKPVPVSPSWIGHWTRDTSAEIDIERKSDTQVRLSGNATWGEGAGTNVGEIAAILDATTQTQSFATDGDKQVAYDKADQYECAVKLKQLGSYLVVTDNGNCGGANVSFSGVYGKR